MRLLVQPGDGASALIKGIHAANSSIQIAIFRFDQKEIEKALAHAVSRGVSVHALIAHTNSTGAANLRKLELRLLAAGMTVGRTADDLRRYHGKFMIVDRRELYLLAFNLTYHDMKRCRSFGVITRRRDLVNEAIRLFEADASRIPYDAASDALVISPVNARRKLSAFIRGTRKQLLIYDPKISDPEMLRLLNERADAGVDIQIIGKVAGGGARFAVRALAQRRLHTRTMIRDGEWAFIGSQSLRGVELDMRREAGVIFRDARIISQLTKTFQEDWPAVAPENSTEVLARKVAKAVAKEIPAVAPVVNSVVKEFAAAAGDLDVKLARVEAAVDAAVKEAVKEAVKDAVEETVDSAHNN